MKSTAITKIESQPDEIRRVSIKSMEIEFQGHSGIRRCFGNP